MFDESIVGNLNFNDMLGGGFMGQAHQTNKQNREMLKKHKMDKKEFLSGAKKLKVMIVSMILLL